MTAKAKRKPKVKPRKPRYLWLCSEIAADFWEPDYVSLKAVHAHDEAGTPHSIYTAKECRKLAAWLTAAALWLEQREGKK